MAYCIFNIKTNAQGKELIKHGTPAFPIACYYVSDSIPFHWHDEMECGVITQGQILISAGSEKILLKEGDGFFINSGILHAAWNEDSSINCFHSIVFHPRLVGDNIESIFWQNYIQPLISNPSLQVIILHRNNDCYLKCIHLIENAWASCNNGKYGYEFEARNDLSQLISIINSYCPSKAHEPTEKEIRNNLRIKKMLIYIHEHYFEEITIENISKSISVSPSECLRCFHNTIGTTPIQYVKQYRIQKSIDLLDNSHMKVSEIGYECGFQEMSYFAKAFRDIKGCTPSEYRKTTSSSSK